MNNIHSVKVVKFVKAADHMNKSQLQQSKSKLIIYIIALHFTHIQHIYVRKMTILYVKYQVKNGVVVYEF